VFSDAQDWYTSTNPDDLLRAARPLEKVTEKFDAARERRRKVYDRRCRLFGCACARMVWDILPTDGRNAVAISERIAYGQAMAADMDAAAVRVMLAPITFQQHALCAAGRASLAIFSVRYPPGEEAADRDPLDAARSAAKSLAVRAAGPAPPGYPTTAAWESTWNTAFTAARTHQAELVRDIFPPPDHAVRALRLEREWLTSTVLALARQMDDTGDFSAVPILADALQDAGCDNEIMLDRCRAPSGIHSRGNWIVDLVLGRE
jgi:hypothetical protein